MLTPADLTIAILNNATSETFTKTNGIMCEINKENRSTTSVKYSNWFVLPKRISEKYDLPKKLLTLSFKHVSLKVTLTVHL